MTFNSFSFLLLLPVIFSLYYCIPSKYHRQRNLYLLLASYLFYMSWKPLYVFFLLFVTLTTYFFPLLMNGRKDHSRRLVMWSGLIISILPLFLFKYHNFVDGNILLLLSKFGIHFCLPGLNWAIPIGISFFTLQAVGYMLDVYWHRIEAERDFLDYALFVSFFPSIVSGPINKAAVMIPQIKNPRPYFNYEKAVRGLKCLLWGMFLKVVVADRVGLYVWTVDVDFIHFSGSTCLLASVLYTIQIYADFAGYSLMALGVGKLVGIDVQENFQAQTISDKLEYEFRNMFLVKPLDPIKVKKEFDTPVPTTETPKKDKSGVEAVDFDKVKTEIKEVESDFRTGVVLKVPDDYQIRMNDEKYPEMTIKVGDTIVYKALAGKNFDLFKDSQLVSPYDVIGIKK